LQRPPGTSYVSTCQRGAARLDTAAGGPVASIGLQAKARCLEGAIEHYWFENEHVGLPRTLFHRIRIPFEPFDSGLACVQQPEQTELVVEWINFGLDDPAALDGVEIAMSHTPDVEASIYLGAAHNWYQIEKLTLARDGSRYRVTSVGTVEFSREGVASDESFRFEAVAVYRGLA
jgi:hypothetical protein